jgi:dTDP-4-dehydrorhamnose reductase
MVNERVLVTGATGLLGTYFLDRLNDMYKDLFVIEHISQPRFGKKISIDLANLRSVRDELNRLRPTIIINLAALTNVDECETNPALADTINHKLPKEIAEYCHRNKVNGSSETFMLHISTDFVFDGILGNYTEDSIGNPVNVYGSTKLLGECAIHSIVPEQNWCLARFCSAFGLHPKKKTFPYFAIENLLRGQGINAAIDQFNSPSYVVNVSDMLGELLENKRFGTFHIGGSSKLSRYEQAKKIADVLGVDRSLINGMTSSEMNWVAKRPPDSSLCVNKAQRILVNKPLEYDVAIRTFIKEIEVKGSSLLSFRSSPQ